MIYGELAEQLLQRACESAPGEYDDAHEAFLDALRDWHAASDADREGDIQMLSFLLAAIDGGDFAAPDAGIVWMAHVLRQLTEGQHLCGDEWRTLPLRFIVERLTGATADFGGLAWWAWEALALPESLASPVVAEALQRAARASAEAHAALMAASNALDAAAGEWTVDGEGAQA